MNKRVIVIGCIVTSLAIPVITYTAGASSVAQETEMAGMSMMIEEYYYSQVAGRQPESDVVTPGQEADPEAIVDPDELAGEGSEKAANSAEITDIAGLVIAPEGSGETGRPEQPEGAEQPTAVDQTVDGDRQEGTAPEASGQPEETGVSDGEQPVEGQPAGEEQAAQEPVQEEKSEFDNIGISIANQYVHIRRRPSTESKILGKLYRGSAATIVATKGDWVKIKSGSVEGFIKSEYLAIGRKAEKLADRYGTKIATVNTTTLKVREETNTDCTVLTLVPDGEEFEVTRVYKEWVKIIVDEGTKGYVSREYVDLSVEFEEAISIEEEEELERQRREAEEAARQAEEAERARRAAEAAAAASSSSHSSSSSSSSSSHSSSSSSSSSHSSSSSSSSHTDTSTVSTGSGTGSDAAAYAQKFVGCPYSYGGTSLTSGADCSGFVQSVYKKYGISLPRTSGEQAGTGRSVSLDSVQPGDVIYYSSGGRVNHVAIYIGDGKVVHASNRRTGIKTSNMRYRTPSGARRVAG